MLVNNAGYGFEGAIEEASLDQVRAQFAVNVFGAVSVIQTVLPYMRSRRAGHIVNITSMGGLTAFPASESTTAASTRSKASRRRWPRR